MMPSPCLSWAAPYRIRTPRLWLAPACEATAPQLAQIMLAPRVHEPFFVGRPSPAQLQADGEQWQQQPERWQRDQEFNLVARLHEGGEVVGCVQLFPQLIAYFVAPRFWHQGYASEMVAARCEVLPRLLGIARLERAVIRENLASRRVLEKSGFHFSGMELRQWQGRPGQVAMLWYRRDF